MFSQLKPGIKKLIGMLFKYNGCLDCNVTDLKPEGMYCHF